MNRTHFYIFVIITFAALVWPYTAVSQNFTLTSDEEVQRIVLEKFQQKLGAFQQILESHYEKYQYIPVIILLNGILWTYCWCILGRKVQSILVFVFGFTLGGPFYSSLLPILKFAGINLNPNLSEQTIFLISGLTGGLFAFVGYWISVIAAKIFIRPGCVIICFAVSIIILILVMFALKNRMDPKLFNQINFTKVIAVIIIMTLITDVIAYLHLKYKIVEIVLCATAGAATIVYLFLSTKALSIYKIATEVDLKRWNIKDENQLILIVILAVTGIIVQWTLLSITRRYKSKSQDRVSDQVQVS